jgi:predicted MFS family arabinose efflux permease
VTAPTGRLGIIFLTVLIDLVGFGIILPILPYVAQRFGAGGLGLGILMGGFSGMQFVANTVLGRMSDRIGRRPVLLATMLFNALGYLLFAAAGTYPLLLLARLVSGFASGNISVAQAYIADVTPPERRSRGMGMLGMAFGIGFVLGPAIGGLAGHYGGHAAPALVAAGLSLANLALAWRILPESLHEHHRSDRGMLDFSHAREALKSPVLRPLMMVWLAAAFAFAGYTTLLPLHANAVWGWRERELGGLFTAIGLVTAVGQGWAFGHLARRFGDRRLLIAGMFGMAITIGVIPFVARVPVLFAWTVGLAFANSLFAPAATGLTSVLAGPAEQGAMLGVAQSLAALGRLMGPEALGGTLDQAGATAAFLAAAAVMAAGTVAGLLVPARPPGTLRPTPSPGTG